MSAMAPVPKDDPLMIAWEAYKATDEYANTRHWALKDAHVDGSLWAAFSEGFNTQRSKLSTALGHLKAIIHAKSESEESDLVTRAMEWLETLPEETKL